MKTLSNNTKQESQAFTVLLLLSNGTYIEKEVFASTAAMAQIQAADSYSAQNLHVVGGCVTPMPISTRIVSSAYELAYCTQGELQ